MIITYLDKVLHKDFLSLKTVKKTTKKKCLRELTHKNVEAPHAQKEHN